MEGGVIGDIVVLPVELEAGEELVQTLPQPMEDMIVSENLVGIATWMAVGEIQDALTLTLASFTKLARESQTEMCPDRQNTAFVPVLTGIINFIVFMTVSMEAIFCRYFLPKRQK